MVTLRDRLPAFGVALLVTVAGFVVANELVHSPPRTAPVVPCDTIGAPLEVSVSTEKASGDPEHPKAVDAIATRYNETDRRVTVDGRAYCARVHVTSLTSGSTEQGLRSGWTDPKFTLGKPEPEVWLPSSSIWPELLARNTKKSPPRTAIDSLAQSPLVLGLPLSKALALDRHLHGQQFNWSFLQRLVDERNVPRSWGQDELAAGDPGWGRFHLKKDDPIASTSGLAAVVTAYLDLHRSYPGWKIEDNNMKRAFRKLEGLVSAGGYTSDGTEMMRQLAALDAVEPGWGADTSAVVVQETLIYQYDMHVLAGGAPDRDPAELIVPFYPANPLGMDHPYVELSLLDGKPARQAVADDFGRFLQGDYAQDQFSAAGLRDPDGRALPGLDALDAKLQKQNRMPQRRVVPPTNVSSDWPPAADVERIQRLWQQTRKRAHVLVLMDESITMNEQNRMGQAKTALQNAIQTWTTPNDRVAVWGFSAPKGDSSATVSREVMPWSPGGASAALDKGIKALKARRDTPLYRAVKLARAEVARQPSVDETGEWANVVVVLTDGEDDFVGEPAAIAYEPDNDVPVHSIAFGPKAATSVGALREIASRTHGGYQDAIDPLAVDKAFAALVRVA